MRSGLGPRTSNLGQIGMIVVFALAACELVPAPKQSAVGAPPAPTAPDPQPTLGEVRGPTSDVPIADDDPCVATSIHFADVVIADAKDAQQRGTMERERPQLVRRTKAACDKLAWDDTTRACIAAANRMTELQFCEQQAANAKVGLPAPHLPDPRAH
jgi:hypothetical protein